MYTVLFGVATILGILSLIKIQPVDRRSIFDPGVLTIFLFSLCYLLPSFGVYLGVDMGSTIAQAYYWPEIELLSLYGCLFVLSFVFFYIIIKPFSGERDFSAIDWNVFWSPKACLIGYVSLYLIIKVILIYFGVFASGIYTDQYVVQASIPAIFAQGIGLLQSLQWMFIYLLLASSFSLPNKKYQFSFVGLAFGFFIVDMWFTNSRSNLVSFLILTMTFGAFNNRSIGLKKEIIFSTLFVVLLGLFSLRRDVNADVFELSISDIVIPSEFVFIYSNAVYLLSLHGTVGFVPAPGNSYLQSLIAFIPKQLNEGKWDLASWFMNTYFSDAYEAGQGLAFGIIPEALVNWGLISIVFQAFIIAFIYRFAAYRSKSTGETFWVLLHLYCIALIYHEIRSHSFAAFQIIAIGFIIPYFILVKLGKFLFLLNR